MKRNLIAAVLVVATGVIQGGCASQTTTETNFGDAVREVTMNQTYDLGASVFSNSDPVVGGDPYQLENVINTHRERSSQPSNVGSEIRIGTSNH
jgi:hypothetical protein